MHYGVNLNDSPDCYHGWSHAHYKVNYFMIAHLKQARVYFNSPYEYLLPLPWKKTKSDQKQKSLLLWKGRILSTIHRLRPVWTNMRVQSQLINIYSTEESLNTHYFCSYDWVGFTHFSYKILHLYGIHGRNCIVIGIYFPPLSLCIQRYMLLCR